MDNQERKNQGRKTFAKRIPEVLASGLELKKEGKASIRVTLKEKTFRGRNQPGQLEGYEGGKNATYR